MQPFAGGQQAGMGVAYPSAQSVFDPRLAQASHGGRTPGGASFRSPFAQNPQTRLSQSQSGSAAQTASEPEVPGLAVLDASAGASASAGVANGLEGLSLNDDLAGRRLSPIVTHASTSPSDVILASVTRGRPPELNSAALAQMSQSDAAPPPMQLEQPLNMAVPRPTGASEPMTTTAGTP